MIDISRAALMPGRERLHFTRDWANRFGSHSCQEERCRSFPCSLFPLTVSISDASGDGAHMESAPVYWDEDFLSGACPGESYRVPHISQANRPTRRFVSAAITIRLSFIFPVRSLLSDRPALDGDGRSTRQHWHRHHHRRARRESIS